MDVLPTGISRSLRVRTSSIGTDVANELQLCPSAMSADTKKMLPPTSTTIMTKPFPIRGKYFIVVFLWFLESMLISKCALTYSKSRLMFSLISAASIDINVTKTRYYEY